MSVRDRAMRALKKLGELRTIEAHLTSQINQIGGMHGCEDYLRRSQLRRYFNDTSAKVAWANGDTHPLYSSSEISFEDWFDVEARTDESSEPCKKCVRLLELIEERKACRRSVGTLKGHLSRIADEAYRLDKDSLNNEVAKLNKE